MGAHVLATTFGASLLFLGVIWPVFLTRSVPLSDLVIYWAYALIYVCAVSLPLNQLFFGLADSGYPRRSRFYYLVLGSVTALALLLLLIGLVGWNEVDLDTSGFFLLFLVLICGGSTGYVFRATKGFILRKMHQTGPEGDQSMR